MARRRTGRIIFKQDLSPILTIFRLTPEAGHPFPASTAGQYIALGRDDALVTRQAGVGPDGKPIFVPDLDRSGAQKTAPMTHAYSIASAPWEQERYGYLEFYLILALSRGWVSGRLSSVLLRLRPDRDNAVQYVHHIAGTFTLDQVAAGFEHVIMVGTGTGLSPFVAMVKQLHHDAGERGDEGRRATPVAGADRRQRRYTLLHTNRVYEELAYHARLLEIEREGRFDFTYLATVSRPSPQDHDNGGLGVGRANNVLRHLFDLPTREDEALSRARAEGGDLAGAEAAAARVVRPRLPRHLSAAALRATLTPARTVILTCGNPASMADIALTAERTGIAFRKEDW